MAITIEEVTSALQHVVHPAAKKSIVELGMVDDIRIDGLNISFALRFPRSKDPMENSIVKACEKALKYYVHPEAVAQIEVRFPIAQPVKPNIEAKNVIAVASGKGGVGKSTIAVNLAVALAKMGYRVGLLDADIYGPSTPKMLGVENAQPEVHGTTDHERIVPVESYGVRVLSIGFFVRPEDAVIWRAPMVTSALKQLLFQGDWGQLDYLLIDMPPGTGDVHLTIVQELRVTGAIIVSTPQQVALLDVVRGIDMFQHENVKVPILGLVENMAWFTPAELPNNRYYIFGKDSCRELAERYHIKLLGQIPIVQSISESGDKGRPMVADEESVTGQAFMQLAKELVTSL